MKFISKNSNLRIVLKPSVPAERLTGRAPVPGLYARFENGMLDVTDEETINALRLHPGFDSDFIAVDEADEERIRNYRTYAFEPEHDMIQMQYGTPGKNLNPKPPITVTPELKKYIEDTATAMAKEIITKTLASKLEKEEVKAEAPKESVIKKAEKVSQSVSPEPTK